MNKIHISFIYFAACSMLCPVPVLNTEVADKNACSIPYFELVNDEVLTKISSYI